jgi:hypothetical protein
MLMQAGLHCPDLAENLLIELPSVMNEGREPLSENPIGQEVRADAEVDPSYRALEVTALWLILQHQAWDTERGRKDDRMELQADEHMTPSY